MYKKREGKSVIQFGCLYRLGICLHLCRKLTSANLLEEITYKIIDLKRSKLNKKKLECINGETAEGTDWPTAGIAYLLSNSRDIQ